MLGKSGNAVLDSALEPLAPFLNRKNLVEFCCNAPGEAALEIAGRGWVFEKAPELALPFWNKLCHVLANTAGQRFDPLTQPTVSTRIPGGHRFEASMGKTVRSGISVTIRLKRKLAATLEDFGLAGDDRCAVEQAIACGANVILSGGTSTGKTTLLNLLLQLIPRDKRIIVLEDTAELDVPHRNHVAHDLSRNDKSGAVGYPEKFDHAMRSRPDQILLGELSIANTFPALLLLNSGHRGFLCTMHADSARLALEEGFYQRIALAGHSTIEPRYLASYLRKTVDLVIQVGRTAGERRQVTELWWPAQGAPRRLVEGESLAA